MLQLSQLMERARFSDESASFKTRLLIVGLAVLALSGRTTWHPPQSDEPGCNPEVWEHIHKPGRLLDPKCVTGLTGTIITEGYNREDGDWIAKVDLDPQFDYLLDEKNKMWGDEKLLIVEIPCEAPEGDQIVFRPSECSGYDEDLQQSYDNRANVGDRVVLDGWLVYDENHGYGELHPAVVQRELPNKQVA